MRAASVEREPGRSRLALGFQPWIILLALRPAADSRFGDANTVMFPMVTRHLKAWMRTLNS